MGTAGPFLQTPNDDIRSFNMNLNQNDGTYDLFTANGDIEIESIVFYVSQTGTGLVSVSAQDNDTTPTEYLSAAEGAAANLTAGKNLKTYTTKKILASGKKVRYTIVTNGSGGNVKAFVTYRPLVFGATIS